MKYQNTKRQIFEKSLDFFSINGFSGTSIRQISRAIGIRESTIYNHYKSKEEIFSAILAEFKTKSIVKEILSDDLLDILSTPEIFLNNFTKRLIELWDKPEERKFIRLLLMEQFTKNGSHDLSISEYLKDIRSICKMILGEMIKAGIIKKAEPETLTEQFIAPLFLLRIEKMSFDNTQNINEVFALSEKHVNYFWNAVKQKTGSQ
jgi:AcrR family transcriptional regulator